MLQAVLSPYNGVAPKAKLIFTDLKMSGSVRPLQHTESQYTYPSGHDRCHPSYHAYQYPIPAYAACTLPAQWRRGQGMYTPEPLDQHIFAWPDSQGARACVRAHVRVGVSVRASACVRALRASLCSDASGVFRHSRPVPTARLALALLR